VIAAAFLLAAFATRLPVLHRSVLDWDESLYFLMAQSWHAGHLPYTTIWDNKPLGIYAIFAAFQAVFGERIVAMRLAAVAFVAALAWLVHGITLALAADRRAALLAGCAVILCSLSNDGLAANTELFMASFTAAAVLVALRGGPAPAIGLLLGCAFMVKYVAVFEAPVVFFWVLSQRPGRWLRSATFMLAGAALPLLAVVLLYAANGKLALWWDCSVVSNTRRMAAPFTSPALFAALRLQALRWGPLYLAGLATLLRAMWRREQIFPACWLLGGLAGAAAAKSFYDHYFLQVLPVLCVCLGLWFAELRGNSARLLFIVLACSLPVLAARSSLRPASTPDVPREAAAALNAAHVASLSVFDSQPILYALTGLEPPTRYVLPSELTARFLPRVAGIEPMAEVARIFGTEPEFVVRRDGRVTNADAAVYALADRELAAKYRLWRRLPDMRIYRLAKPVRGSPATPPGFINGR
jgi:4-amino-4-deoxy-L-arabinose transferase-like glycosyltransferase